MRARTVSARGAHLAVHLGVTVALAAATLTAIGVATGAGAAGGTGSVSSFVPITPCRLMDTRPAPENVGSRIGPIGAGETYQAAVWGTNGNCTIPATATAVSMNVTAIAPTAASFLTVYPADASRPLAASLNWVAGQAPTPNAVTTTLSAAGLVSFYNLSGTVHLTADVVGYYQPTGNGPAGPPGATGATGVKGADGPNGPANRLSTPPLVAGRWDLDPGRPGSATGFTTPFNLAFDGTNIWATDLSVASLRKIDPVTGSVTTIALPVVAYDVLYDGSNIWVSGGSEVRRINPATNAVTATIAVGASATYLASNGTYVWVSHNGGVTISRITVATGAVIHFSATDTAEGIVFDGTNLWAAVGNGPGGTLERFNPDTNAAVGAPIPVGGDPTGLAFDGKEVWVTLFADDTVVSVDAATAQVVGSPISVGHQPFHLTYDGAAVWATNNASNTVSRIDPTTHAVTATAPTGVGPAGILYDGVDLWIALGSGAVAKVIPF